MLLYMSDIVQWQARELMYSAQCTPNCTSPWPNMHNMADRTVAGNFHSAAAVYSRAISTAKASGDLQPDMAVLYCNRSAANMRLEQFFAVSVCDTA